MVEKASISRKGFLIANGALLLLIAFVCIAPMWHVIMASVSDGAGLFGLNTFLVLPKGTMNFRGYALVFSFKEVLQGYGMTFVYVALSTLFGLMITLFGGYYLSKKTIYQKPITFIILITMMFSGGLIPTYMVIRTLGMLNTIWAIVIPGCTNAIYIMIATTTFKNIPASIEEAAKIDGAGHWRTMFTISFPLAKGIMMVIIMYCVVQQWNSWFNPSIYLTAKRDLWPLQLVMKELLERYSESNIIQSGNIIWDKFNIQYVLYVISTIPILIACPFFQRYFGNISIGGVKE